jgi:hypothetical protein
MEGQIRAINARFLQVGFEVKVIPTPQTQNLCVTVTESPAKSGLRPGMPDAPT